MSQDVVSLLFAGDSHVLLPRYTAGVREWLDAGGTQPEIAVIAHGDDGLIVALVWPEGVSHEVFGGHMLSRIGALGLPRPRVDHGSLASTSFEALAGAL